MSDSRYRLVILNDCDLPETRMIALVREQDGKTEWTYLSADRRFKGSKWLEWNSTCRGDMMTDLHTFGVAPIVELRDGAHMLRVERVAPSRAQYPDGLPRDWQEHIGARSTVRPALVSALKAFTKQSALDEPQSQKATG